jgi:hypothetical protein
MSSPTDDNSTGEADGVVRAEPDAPIDVIDIVRPAALRNFAHAAG